MKKIFFCLLLLPALCGAQMITTVAGNGAFNYNGDGEPAVAGELNYPTSIAVDNAGTIYIADSKNNRIRKVSSAGVITTIAGSGVAGYSGDGVAATAAALNYPTGIAIDELGNCFVADTWNNAIRKISAAGIITTITGNGAAGYSGDGGAATAGQLYFPSGMAADVHGNVFVADVYNECIRKIDSAGVITTVAGIGLYGYNADEVAATTAQLASPTGVTVDATGNLYIADEGNNRIRKVDVSGIIHTIAGTGLNGYSGDGGMANAAELYTPYGLVRDNSGNIYFSEQGNSRIREINTEGIISTIAGDGVAGFSGDGGAPTAAEIYDPYGVGVDSVGSVYFADERNSRVRKIYRSGTEGSIAPYFLIYPIPCRNVLTVVSSVPITNVIITDMWGQFLLDYDCNTQDLNLDVTYYAAAMYFIRINGNVVRKFVKE